MKKDSENFLRDILDAPSPSGFEQPASALFRKRVKSSADKLIHDVHERLEQFRVHQIHSHKRHQSCKHASR